MSGPDEPVLSLFSRIFLRERRRIMEQLQETGHGYLLSYVLQQIEQFKQAGEQFMIQHKDTATMEEIDRAVRAHVLKTTPLDELLRTIPLEERLRGVPAEERLRGIPAEERLRDIPAEEVLRHISLEDALAKLSPKELARLRELIERRTDGSGTS